MIEVIYIKDEEALDVRQYESGIFHEVIDGVLYIKSGYENVAVYADGWWVRAEKIVED